VAIAFGLGFTSTVAVIGEPAQLLTFVVNVTKTGALVVLTNAPVILPDPLAVIPVTVTALSLVQL
jgi:hypothetical protein